MGEDPRDRKTRDGNELHAMRSGVLEHRCAILLAAREVTASVDVVKGHFESCRLKRDSLLRSSEQKRVTHDREVLWHASSGWDDSSECLPDSVNRQAQAAGDGRTRPPVGGCANCLR